MGRKPFACGIREFGGHARVGRDPQGVEPKGKGHNFHLDGIRFSFHK